MATPHGKPLALEQSQFKFPEVICTLDLETSGKDALKPDRADLAVDGLKVYTWDEQQQSYLPGLYEHYAPTEFLALQQRLDELPGPIIGHNLFNFDYLVLHRHLNLEHIIEKTADTLHFLYEQGGGGEDRSLYGLDKLAKENFGERKTAKGSTVPKLLKEGKLAEVLAYNEHDCDLTFRLWWKMVSERHVSTGEMIYEDDFPPEEVTYDLEAKDISVLTCATPRFTYMAWTEQLERDGWIVMPPRERKRREKEREQQRKEAWEAARKRDQVMSEFIEQHFRDDIPRRFAQSKSNNTPASLDLIEEVRALLASAGLLGNAWAERIVYQLLRGEYVHPARVELAGRPNDPEEHAEAMKGILAALASGGYLPRYHAYNEPNGDSVSLADPPPTLAEQYVNERRQRYFEMEALFGPAGIEFEPPLRIASNVHFAYTDAMNVLFGSGFVAFEDGSYVLDTDEIALTELQPKVLTSEEREHLDAYVQDPPVEFTVPWHSGIEGHSMALHCRKDDMSPGTMFHMSCSCGWQSSPTHLEVDALAPGVLHTRAAGQQKDGNSALRFREHTLKSIQLNAPGSRNRNEERWIGLCACGWSFIERTEDDGDEAYEQHWKALLDDPAMRADYLAFREEESAHSALDEHEEGEGRAR